MFLYFPIILQGLGAGVLLHSPIFKTDETYFKIRFDYSDIALITLAILSLGIGAYWSGLDHNRSM